VLAMQSVTLLVKTRLAQGVTAPRLGEGRDTNLASRLIVSPMLPNWIGSLPLSSRDRRSCGGTSPEASHGTFCFNLHICLGSEVLGSQGTWLALRKALLASVEAERSWDKPRPAARLAKAGFCSEALTLEIFLCFRVCCTGLPSESNSSKAQDSDHCIATRLFVAPEDGFPQRSRHLVFH